VGAILVSRCERCCFPPSVCLCASIPRLVTRTRVVILRHHSETLRSSNSGRLAHLALENSVMRDLHGPDRVAPDLPISAGAWLVYPEGPPRSVSPVPPPGELIFLDATWQQAKRMRQRTPALRGLPILALDTVGGALRFRKAPRPGQVSTIEAIAVALRMVEGGEAPDALERLFRLAIERMGRTGRVVAGRG
jgi:DTW domain-containing protein YfiP